MPNSFICKFCNKFFANLSIVFQKVRKYIEVPATFLRIKKKFQLFGSKALLQAFTFRQSLLFLDFSVPMFIQRSFICRRNPNPKAGGQKAIMPLKHQLPGLCLISLVTSATTEPARIISSL